MERLKFKPTHVVMHNGLRYVVMLTRVGAAYSREEWFTLSMADFERDSQGNWTYRGAPINGSVEAL